jgi:5-bromo-4-chloroindolyl phosphate hydrolysis protein
VLCVSVQSPFAHCLHVCSQNRTRFKLEAAEKEAESAASKLGLAQKQLQEANIKHSLTKEELKVARNNLQHVKQQCQHELRKKERENEKLKDRVNKASNDRTQQTKRLVLRCLNALPKMQTSSSLHDQDVGIRNFWSSSR